MDAAWVPNIAVVCTQVQNQVIGQETALGITSK